MHVRCLSRLSSDTIGIERPGENNGSFYYTIMPFGIKNVGATYQRLIDQVFKDKMKINIEVYVDDILVKVILG